MFMPNLQGAKGKAGEKGSGGDKGRKVLYVNTHTHSHTLTHTHTHTHTHLQGETGPPGRIGLKGSRGMLVGAWCMP